MTRNDFLSQVKDRVDIVSCEWEYECLVQSLNDLELDDRKVEYDYFYDKMAPRLLESQLDGVDLLYLLEQGAGCVGMGKDIEPFVGENGSVLANMGYRLPDINDDPSVKQSTFQQLKDTVAIIIFVIQ